MHSIIRMQVQIVRLSQHAANDEGMVHRYNKDNEENLFVFTIVAADFFVKCLRKCAQT